MNKKVVRSLLLVQLLAFTTGVVAQPLNPSDSSQIKNFAAVKLTKGEIIFSGNSSVLNVKIKIDTSPECKFESVLNPTRVVIACKGDFLSKVKPVAIESDLIKRVRFGFDGGISKIVMDIKGEAPQVDFKKEDDGILQYVLMRKGLASAQAVLPVASATVTATATASIKTTATAISTVSAIPSSTIHPANGTPAKIPVITPPPRPQLLFGETELYSLVFAKDANSGAATVKINLKAAAKAEIKKEAGNLYLLKISGARVASPIFAQPQIAPEGFEPFLKVTPSEIILPKAPVDLMLKIELLKDSNISVQQKGGEIVISASK